MSADLRELPGGELQFKCPVCGEWTSTGVWVGPDSYTSMEATIDCEHCRCEVSINFEWPRP